VYKIILYLILIGILFTSCNKQETSQDLRLNFQGGDVPSLHPHVFQGHMRGRALGKLLFETLTRLDNQGNVLLTGAESVEISPDFKHFLFYLRPHKWSDGSAVTAFQYEEAWKQAIAPGSDCPRADLFYLIKNAEEAKKGIVSLDEVGVKALDARTLSVELAYPASFFLELMVQPIFAPISNESEPTKFNGPFFITERQRGDHLSLKSNPQFWNHKEVQLDTINIYFVDDAMSAFFMYEKGQLDWIGEPLGRLLPEVLLNMQQKNQPVYQRAVARVHSVFFNTQHPCLKSLSIRKALSSVVDPHLVTQHILIGEIPLFTPLPRTLSILSNDPKNSGIENGKKLFQEGLNELGISLKDMPPLIISYSYARERKQLAEYLKEVWEKTFDISIQLKSVEWNILRSQLEKGQFQISGCNITSVYRDPLEMLEGFEGNTENNFSQWFSSEYHDLISLAKNEVDPKKRNSLLKKAEKMLQDQITFIPISSCVHSYIHPPNLQNISFDHAGCVDFSYASFTQMLY